MNELIVGADAELLAIQHLDTELSVPVSQSVPPTRPASFVTVRRTGGPRQTLVTDAAQLTVEAWADSAPAASALARLAQAAIHRMPPLVGGVPVYRVDDFAGPAYLPDPESAQSRYTFTVAVHCRASVPTP